MKKLFFAALVAAFSFTQNASAQSLGNILGKLGNTAKEAVGNTSIGNVISNALGVTTTSIVGSWVYQEPAVLFTSDDLLSKAGGKLAAQQVEKKLKTYFEKAGIKQGTLTMTFDNSGNFTQTVKGKTVKGTYTVESGNVNLKYTGGVKQFVGTTQLDGNNLVIVVDVSKILSFAQTLTANSGNSTLSSISSLTKNIKGMKAGLKLQKN